MGKFLLKFYILFFCFLPLFSQEKLIEKIVYKSYFISFDQDVFITVFFKVKDISDISLFFNNKEISLLNKNISIFAVSDSFLQSVSFIVNSVLPESELKIFFKLKDNSVLVANEKLYFYKTLVIEDPELEIQQNKSFFLKVGPALPNFYYSPVIDNQSSVVLLEYIIVNDTVYYRAKSLIEGIAKIFFYRVQKDQSISDNSNLHPYKIFIAKVKQ